MDAGGTLDRLMSCLPRALSIRKLGFFLVSQFLALLVCAVLIYVATKMDNILSLVVVVLAWAFFTGMLGVTCGGVAFLAHTERQSVPASIGDTVSFCGERFVSLFFSFLLLLLAVAAAGGIVNWVIHALTQSGKVGSLLTGVLFLPHFLANLALLLCLMMGTIVPCSIAVERIGAIRALSRLVTCIRQHPRELLIQYGLALIFSGILLSLLSGVVGPALYPTMAVNSGSEEYGRRSRRSRRDAESMFDEDWFSSSRRSPKIDLGTGAGMVLRALALLLILAAVLSCPAVYWIVAFTDYYAGIQPTLDQPTWPTA